MMMSRRGEGKDAGGEENELPWDPFWEYFLGEDTDDDDEPVHRQGFRWRRQVADDSSDDESDGHAGARVDQPLTKALSGESKEERSACMKSRLWPVAKTDSKETVEVWSLDLEPFGSGSWMLAKSTSKEDTVEMMTPATKRRSWRTSCKSNAETQNGNSPSHASSATKRKGRFFGLGKRRSGNSSSFSSVIPDTKRQETSSKRSLFSRSSAAPDTTRPVAVLSKRKQIAAPKIRRKSKDERSSQDSISQTLELAGEGLSRGLETLSHSGSKLLDWSGLDESSDESEKQRETVATKAIPKKKAIEEKRDVNLPVDEQNTALSGSFNAMLHWMEGSETENSSVGTSTLDDSKGTQSVDDLGKASLDGSIEIDDEPSLQLSSQIFDNESDSTTDQELSLQDEEDESNDTDDQASEGHTVEETSCERDQDANIFIKKHAAEFTPRNGSAFSAARAITSDIATNVVATRNKEILRPFPQHERTHMIKSTPILARQLTHSFSEQNSIIEEEETVQQTARKSPKRDRGSKPNMQGTLSRIGAFLPTRTLTPQQKYLANNKGVPYHELSPQELAELFPKVRSIGDGDSTCSSSFFADKSEFDQSKPAHLQASIPRRGPQSLYEYEYETGVHMYAAYSEFGSERTCPMTVNTGRVPIPSPVVRHSKENGIILQVEASTVSQTDCSIRAGEWWGPDSFSLPNSPGVDVVGRIYSLDPETKRRTGLMKGERVMSLVQWGGNSRYLRLDPSQLVKVPEYVDPAATVCLAETYLTAFQVLHFNKPSEARYETLSLRENRILIIGKAITNLGRAISEIGKAAGGKVFALAKERHFSKVSLIGIVPRDVDSLDWWNELCGKIDTIVCIDEDVPTIYYKLLKANGRVLVIKSSINGYIQSGPTKTESTTRWKSRRKQKETTEQPDTTKIYDVFSEWKTNLGLCKADLNHLIDMMVQKKIQPQVLDRIPLSKVGQAQQLIKGRSIKGYIVCEPWLVAKSRAIVL